MVLKDIPMVRLDSLTFTRSVYSFLHRPTRDSLHVSPDKWRDYRENHEFLNPSCLCALLKLQGKGEAPRYTEVAIYLQATAQWVLQRGVGSGVRKRLLQISW